MSNDLSTLERRGALAPRHEPYWEKIVRGVALGYRRGARGGTWHVRWRDFCGGKRFQSLGAADDGSDYQGLSYEQAKEQAIRAVRRALEASPVENESEDRISDEDDGIDRAAVQRIVEATRSTRFQPPAIDLAALAEDLRSVRKPHRRRAREAPQVAADFQNLVNAIDAVMNICERITNDQTRKDMLLSAIMFRNKGGPFLLPEMELQRLTHSNVELQLLAKNCADASRFFKECSEEMGAPSHYFLLARALPRVYEKHFGRPFGRSTDLDGQRTGPGVRFVMAAAELVGIRKPDATLYSPETLRTAEREIRKTRRE